ncbi:hypothetical protein [Limosilactobacillus reuteri]|uniref:hypothetical protein n=1 Tax=Limosilactobacillus reuteri TaxID=1598 RepID=UPI001E56486F|nr:hypothetical protein [Limosilactobacillus reuteri]MCC4487530.1 hypothetical protein [Limosilactobacillus reuteri]
MTRTTLRMTKSTESKINYFEAKLENNPALIKNIPSSNNGLINMLLNDYLTLIINAWNKSPRKRYETIYQEFLSTHDTKLNNLIKHEQKQMNRINEILYLLMATNQAVVRVDKDDWKNMQSMFEFGTRENEIYAKLSQMVEIDNKKLFQKGK